MTVLLILTFAIRGKKDQARRHVDQRQGDRAQRTQIVNEILKAVGSLREAGVQAASPKIGRTDLAEQIRKIRDSLDALSREVNAAEATGKAPTINTQELQTWQEAMDRMLREVTAESQEIHEALLAQRIEGMEGKLNDLEGNVNRLRAKWGDRQGVLARLG